MHSKRQNLLIALCHVSFMGGSIYLSQAIEAHPFMKSSLNLTIVQQHIPHFFK